MIVFMGVVSSPHHNPQGPRYLLIQNLTQNLCAIGDPAAARQPLALLALHIAHKLPPSCSKQFAFNTLEAPLRGLITPYIVLMCVSSSQLSVLWQKMW